MPISLLPSTFAACGDDAGILTDASVDAPPGSVPHPIVGRWARLSERTGTLDVVYTFTAAGLFNTQFQGQVTRQGVWEAVPPRTTIVRTGTVVVGGEDLIDEDDLWSFDD